MRGDCEVMWWVVTDLRQSGLTHFYCIGNIGAIMYIGYQENFKMYDKIEYLIENNFDNSDH